MGAAVGPDLDPGGSHRPNLIPIEEELSVEAERLRNAGSFRERVDQFFDGVITTECFHSFDQWIEVMRTCRPVEPRKPLQMVTHWARVGVKRALVTQQGCQFCVGEQIHELSVPEGSIRTDEIRREVDGRWNIVSTKDWKREIVVVAPAVVEREDATRTGGPPGGVSVREQSAEPDDLEVLLQDGDLALEGGGRHDHSGL